MVHLGDVNLPFRLWRNSASTTDSFLPVAKARVCVLFVLLLQRECVGDKRRSQVSFMCPWVTVLGRNEHPIRVPARERGRAFTGQYLFSPAPALLSCYLNWKKKGGAEEGVKQFWGSRCKGIGHLPAPRQAGNISSAPLCAAVTSDLCCVFVRLGTG